MNMKLGKRHNKELALKWLRLYRCVAWKGRWAQNFEWEASWKKAAWETKM